MKRLKFRSFHAHEFANANKITQLIRRNSLGRDEISSIRGIVRVSPLIYHIDKGKTAGGAAEESSFVETFVYTLYVCTFDVCSPYVTYLHLRAEKEMSVFSSSLVTCAPELCMPHTHLPSPTTSNMLFEYIAMIQPVIHRFPIFKPCVKDRG